jgi:hypothetical protein
MQNKFAIIVPYRDREQHLAKFLSYMDSKADIIIVEQEPGKPFNRGKLLNIGVLENDYYDYYALHDVDMLPVKADYSKPLAPTLLATKVQQFNYKMPFPEYFGGVVLISRKDIVKCNGYHNEFWGWGGEDDDFRKRVLETIGNIVHREGTYNSLPHDRVIKPSLHQKNVQLLKAGIDLTNGLRNCEYKVLSRDGNHLKVSI